METEASAALSAAERRRLRWRARRGVLENDLLFERFLDRYEGELDQAQAAALQRLLELPDNDLLDLLLERRRPPAALDTEADRQLLARLRAC